MPLLGPAALLLSFDIAPGSIEEHDDWHTHEHFPERLSIPGFLRGTRWVNAGSGPRYMVLYEVAALETLTSSAYLDRLNNPSDWTKKMMPSYRGMVRGLCSVAGSVGLGQGHVARVLRFTPDAAGSSREKLLKDILPSLPSRAGIGGAHLLEGAAAAPMTNEQRIRGADASVASVLIVTGYRENAIDEALSPDDLAQFGATGISDAKYRLDYSLTKDELS